LADIPLLSIGVDEIARAAFGGPPGPPINPGGRSSPGFQPMGLPGLPRRYRQTLMSDFRVQMAKHRISPES
jgi:hypothetical protein